METSKNFNIRLEGRLKNAELMKAREYLGLNQREAAELIGTSPANLGHYEALRAYPSKKMQARICSTYRAKGYFILEEDVFPEQLKKISVKKRIIEEREIPVENLLPLFQAQKELPYIEPEAINELNAEEVKQAVNESLSNLTERERIMIEMNFGINRDRQYSLAEIGEEFGLCRSRINQIIDKGLRKLRRPRYQGKLKEFY